MASDADVQADTRRLHRLVAQAGLEHLRRVEGSTRTSARRCCEQYESRLRYRRQVEGLVDGDLGGDDAGRAAAGSPGSRRPRRNGRR